MQTYNALLLSCKEQSLGCGLFSRTMSGGARLLGMVGMDVYPKS